MATGSLFYYTVISKPGIDIADINYYIQKDTSQENEIIREYYPDREIAPFKSYKLNDRFTIYELSKEEVDKLSNNPDVESVGLYVTYSTYFDSGSPFFIDTGSILNTRQSNFSINLRNGYGGDFPSGLLDDTCPALNWGLDWHAKSTGSVDWFKSMQISSASFPSTYQYYNQDYTYTLDGEGVDLVILDTGIQKSHPEFLNEDGSSRVVEYDWAQHVPETFPNGMPDNYYRDWGKYSYHGTHVASVAAGNLSGWAKKAAIYDANIFPYFVNKVFPIEDMLEAIRLFHKNKPIDPNTGFKRPTIVNASVGTFINLFNKFELRPSGSDLNIQASSGITKLVHQGITYTPTSSNFYPDPYKFQFRYTVNYTYRLPTFNPPSYQVAKRVDLPIGFSLYELLIEQLVKSGVIFVVAAGNYNNVMARSGSYEQHGGLYNNYLNTSAFTLWGIQTTDPIYYNDKGFASHPDTVVAGGIGPYLVLNKGTITDPSSLAFGSYKYDMFGPIRWIRSPEPVPTEFNHGDVINWQNKKGYGQGDPFPGWDVAYASASYAVASFSSVGPAIDIFAAAEYVNGAGYDGTYPFSIGNVRPYSLYTPLDYPYNSIIHSAGEYPPYAVGIPIPQKLMLADGTSFASPNVAGVACLYFQMNPGANVKQFKKFLSESAQRIPKVFNEDPNNSPTYSGSGLMNVPYNPDKTIALNGAPPLVLNWPYVKPITLNINRETPSETGSIFFNKI